MSSRKKKDESERRAAEERAYYRKLPGDQGLIMRLAWGRDDDEMVAADLDAARRKEER
ncbi:hypothetical protein [Phenylobacterium sp.]|uniref:hypothetical protein n=1 Tax=Phenylobacterium sp. TaxID=1871053 RepID=UPI002737A132|nr:hypothetical protein [Phenylobacterium sp.]MDP3870404.1 hypothetical protein [Phenylobacterium sp.]